VFGALKANRGSHRIVGLNPTLTPIALCLGLGMDRRWGKPLER